MALDTHHMRHQNSRSTPFPRLRDRFHTLVGTAAFVVCLALATPAAAQEEKYFGLDRAQIGEIMGCNVDAVMHVGFMSMVDRSVDVEQNLRAARAMNNARPKPLPDADLEMYVRNAYAAGATDEVAVGRKRFTDCLARSSIKTTTDRGGRCWMLTFYFDLIITTERSQGRSPEQIVDRLAKPGASEGERARIAIIVESFLQRPQGDVLGNSLRDVGLFLQCLEMTPGPTEYGYRNGLD
jgi:hypothetical protein